MDGNYLRLYAGAGGCGGFRHLLTLPLPSVRVVRVSLTVARIERSEIRGRLSRRSNARPEFGFPLNPLQLWCG